MIVLIWAVIVWCNATVHSMLIWWIVTNNEKYFWKESKKNNEIPRASC